MPLLKPRVPTIPFANPSKICLAVISQRSAASEKHRGQGSILEDSEGQALAKEDTIQAKQKQCSASLSLLELEGLRPQSAAAQEAAAALKAASLVHASDAPMRLNTQPVPRFQLDDPAGMQYLSDNGYVVLKGALSTPEVSRAHDLLWEFLRNATQWQRGKMETWDRKSFRMCGLPHWGIIKARGAGQSELVWYLRTRPSVKNAFARIWGTHSLISSFDGFNVFLPWHHGFQKTEDGFRWLHTDQGHAKRGLNTIQGFVALTDQDATTGGLHVIPGSHHLHQDWVTDEHPGSPHDFCMIHQGGNKGAALLNLPQQLVTCRAGDLVLWDSRCVHSNTPAVEPPTTPEGELLRVAVYVCMIPKSLASEADLRRRRIAYDEGVSANHWPLFSQKEFEMFIGGAGDFEVQSLTKATDGRQDLIF